MGEHHIQAINGNTSGIKQSQRSALERIFRRRTAPGQVVSPELARHLSSFSRELGRQIGVLLSRDGIVHSVILGDATHLELPEIGRLRGGTGRLRGLRLVHTHLQGEPITQDDLNDLALLRLDLVAAIQVGPDGAMTKIELVHIIPVMDGSPLSMEPFRKIEAPDIYRLNFNFDEEIRAIETEFAGIAGKQTGETFRERAIILALTPGDNALTEIVELVRAAGVEIAEVMQFSGGKIHPRTVIGRGRLQKAALTAMRRGADAAIFDIDLKPAQSRAFEDTTGLKAVDRTQLILDIFAQRARSRDGKLQVELAQLKYSLPRLTEKDAGLSRLVGGIGGRGPGETVLEIGRRRARDRIRRLEKEIEKLSRQRGVRRQRRIRQGLPVLSIIGYTNAGKSTLLNALTESSIDTADRMFVTLDPASRRLRFPRRGEVIITDTVGFIRDLPPDLVTAFRATLEELSDAGLLLHVIDASDHNLENKMEAVNRVLADLELRSVPRLSVLNKADLVPLSILQELCRRHNAVAVSARNREGLEELIKAAEEIILFPSRSDSKNKGP
ncbi:MAG TPA: GTPase HflX [Acidobacteriota bacterium]|nr:GTPase HflX [Acidobacteriota bacterium]